MPCLQEYLTNTATAVKEAGCNPKWVQREVRKLLGMIAGNICPKYRANLVWYGISEKAIYSAERMLGYVRLEAIGKPMLFDEDAVFVVMRFSQNDENDHACLYGIKPALEKLKVKCIRADNQISSGQLL